MNRLNVPRLKLAAISVAACALLLVVAAALALSPSPLAPPAAPARDPVLRMPGIDQFIQQYPTDWEQRIHPDLKPMVDFQRWIGEHGTVVSFADNAWSWSNPFPKVRVFIIDYDGADLFAQGAPRFYHFKPVEFVPVTGPTAPLGG